LQLHFARPDKQCQRLTLSLMSAIFLSLPGFCNCYESNICAVAFAQHELRQRSAQAPRSCPSDSTSVYAGSDPDTWSQWIDVVRIENL
jgi:hypothetical protein